MVFLALLFSSFTKSLAGFPASVAFSFCCADSEMKHYMEREEEFLTCKVAPGMHFIGQQ